MAPRSLRCKEGEKDPSASDNIIYEGAKVTDPTLDYVALVSLEIEEPQERVDDIKLFRIKRGGFVHRQQLLIIISEIPPVKICLSR